MMRSMIFAAALVLAPHGTAMAQTIDCAIAMSTHDMAFCATIDLEAADKALNAAYAKALAQIKSHDGDAPHDAKSYEAAFRIAQRAWIAYRDADCQGVVPFHWGGGTATGMSVTGCLTAKTLARTKDLEEAFGPQ